jgi:hypothetical protein
MMNPEVHWTRRGGYVLTAESSFVDILLQRWFWVICGVQEKERGLGTPTSRNGSMSKLRRGRGLVNTTICERQLQRDN